MPHSLPLVLEFHPPSKPRFDYGDQFRDGVDEGFHIKYDWVVNLVREVEALASAPTFSVYVGNLLVSVSKTLLRDLFLKFGDIDDVFLSKKLKCPNASRYAFVHFHVQAEAHVAILESNGMSVD